MLGGGYHEVFYDQSKAFFGNSREWVLAVLHSVYCAVVFVCAWLLPGGFFAQLLGIVMVVLLDTVRGLVDTAYDVKVPLRNSLCSHGTVWHGVHADRSDGAFHLFGPEPYDLQPGRYL